MDARTRIVMHAASAALLLAALAPGVAYAQETVTHSQAVTRVSGAQVMQQIIGQLRGVQVGSSATTVTLDVDGQTKPVRIDYASIAGATGRSGGSDSGIGALARLFAIPVAGGALLKLVSMLSRLTGRG